MSDIADRLTDSDEYATDDAVPVVAFEAAAEIEKLRAENETLRAKLAEPRPLPLAAKRTGMRISADGILGRIRDGRYSCELRFGCGEMLRHLEEMAGRFYAGDIAAVDEFLQLYCLDDKRPEQEPPT